MKGKTYEAMKKKLYILFFSTQTHYNIYLITFFELSKYFRYNQWRSLKDSVKSSMHWATPNTSGRMIDLHEQNSPISLNSSPVDDKGESNSNK